MALAAISSHMKSQANWLIELKYEIEKAIGLLNELVDSPHVNKKDCLKFREIKSILEKL